MTVIFSPGKYNPPGDASTLLAAKKAMWEDHVEGKEGSEADFWTRLAVLMSDVASSYNATIKKHGSESAVYFDQEIWIARNYLEMTGRLDTPAEGSVD